MQKRRLKAPSPALVISLLALFVALGGTSYAAINLPRNSVGTKQLKKGAVTGKKIRNHTIAKKKLTKKTLAALKGRTGPQGPAGPQGPQGATGATGATGAAGAPALIARTRLNTNNAQASTTSMTFTKVETLGQFTKKQSNTVLRIIYNTEIGAPSGDYCFVQLRVDDLNDAGSSSTGGNTATGSEAGEYDGNTAATVFAVFTGFPAGTHTLSVWERSASGGTCTENTGGWARSAFVEEGS